MYSVVSHKMYRYLFKIISVVLSHPDHEENWCCPSCALPKLSESFFDDFVTSDYRQEPKTNPNNTIFDDSDDHIVNEHIDPEENYLKIFSKNMKSGQNILNIGQLNICSLRNKVDEPLRIILDKCKLGILAI